MKDMIYEFERFKSSARCFTATGVSNSSVSGFVKSAAVVYASVKPIVDVSISANYATGSILSVVAKSRTKSSKEE